MALQINYTKYVLNLAENELFMQFEKSEIPSNFFQFFKNTLKLTKMMSCVLYK